MAQQQTEYPNAFLLNELHNDTCFCVPCRRNKIRRLTNYTNEQLRNGMTELANGRGRRSEFIFQYTLRQICHGKQYKSACLRGTGMTYFKSWALLQPYYQQFVNGSPEDVKRFDEHCQFINDSALCFDNWEKIVHNLNDRRITKIDAKLFSVHLFALANSAKWCKDYDAKLSRGREEDDPNEEEPIFNENEVNILFEMIKRAGITDRPGFTANQASLLGKSIQKKLTNYVRSRDR